MALAKYYYRDSFDVPTEIKAEDNTEYIFDIFTDPHSKKYLNAGIYTPNGTEGKNCSVDSSGNIVLHLHDHGLNPGRLKARLRTTRYLTQLPGIATADAGVSTMSDDQPVDDAELGYIVVQDNEAAMQAETEPDGSEGVSVMTDEVSVETDNDFVDSEEALDEDYGVSVQSDTSFGAGFESGNEGYIGDKETVDKHAHTETTIILLNAYLHSGFRVEEEQEPDDLLNWDYLSLLFLYKNCSLEFNRGFASNEFMSGLFGEFSNKLNAGELVFEITRNMPGFNVKELGPAMMFFDGYCSMMPLNIDLPEVEVANFAFLRCGYSASSNSGSRIHNVNMPNLKVARGCFAKPSFNRSSANAYFYSNFSPMIFDNLVDGSLMFCCCNKAKSLNHISSITLPKLYNAVCMFYGAALESVDSTVLLPAGRLNDVSGMFYNATLRGNGAKILHLDTPEYIKVKYDCHIKARNKHKLFSSITILEDMSLAVDLFDGDILTDFISVTSGGLNDILFIREESQKKKGIKIYGKAYAKYKTYGPYENIIDLARCKFNDDYILEFGMDSGLLTSIANFPEITFICEDGLTDKIRDAFPGQFNNLIAEKEVANFAKGLSTCEVPNYYTSGIEKYFKKNSKEIGSLINDTDFQSLTSLSDDAGFEIPEFEDLSEDEPVTMAMDLGEPEPIQDDIEAVLEELQANLQAEPEQAESEQVPDQDPQEIQPEALEPEPEGPVDDVTESVDDGEAAFD